MAHTTGYCPCLISDKVDEAVTIGRKEMFMDRLWRRVLMGALFWDDDLPEAKPGGLSHKGVASS